MKYTTILFDLDGTLLDTNDLIIGSFLHTLEQFFPEKRFSREDIIPHLGKTLADVMRAFDEHRIEDMMRVYREHNFHSHDAMVQIFPHVQDVLSVLHEKGIKMGVVTTKQRNVVEMGLQLFDLTKYMSTIVTIQDVEQPKPHPEPVLKAMAEIGALAQSTLMVGDSSYDIEAGQRAGVDTAGVAWSLKGVAYLEQYSPTYILNGMPDLLHIVEE